MTQITIDIPDELISLNSLSLPLSDIIAIALEKYIETESYNITQTETWKLGGTLEISQPDSKYIVGQNEQGEIITNYAEKIDHILY